MAAFAAFSIISRGSSGGGKGHVPTCCHCGKPYPLGSPDKKIWGRHEGLAYFLRVSTVLFIAVWLIPSVIMWAADSADEARRAAMMPEYHQGERTVPPTLIEFFGDQCRWVKNTVRRIY